MGNEEITNATVAVDLVYGDDFNGGLVFLPRVQAEDLALLHDAISKAATWGELRASISAERWAEMVDPEESPEHDEPFEADMAYAARPETWPAWPAQEMATWMPADVACLGTMMATLLSGDYLAFDPGDADLVVAALERHGYICEHDPELLDRATGRGHFGW